MKRRELITLLGGAAAWPLAVRAQQAAKVPTIGLLGPTTATAQPQWAAGFLPRLRELGWSEGRNFAIEYRWAAGHIERLTEIAAEFVKLKVDVIVTSGTQAVVAAKNEAAAKAKGVKRVCIPNRSTKSAERKREQKKRWFRNGQKWRTGCEGRISVVKRRHGLNRCRYKGDAGMKRWVGLGVIADNLVNIGRTMEKQAAP